MRDRYEVRISRRALHALRKIDRPAQRRIMAAIELLADEPRPPKCVLLKGEASVYRVRVGDYRIVYEVRDEILVIHVITLGHRRDVYR